MTIAEVPTNGNTKAAATAILAAEPGITARELGNRIGVKERQARNIRNAVLDAAAVPAAGGTGTGGGTSASGSAPAPARRRATDDHRSTVPKTKRGTAEPRRDRWQTAVTVIVGAVAAAWSAGHTIHLAQMAGAGHWSYVTPVVIDGLIFVCARHLRIVDRYWVAKLGLALGVIGTIAANVIAVDPTLVDLRYVLRVLAVAAPVAFIVCAHLLERGAK